MVPHLRLRGNRPAPLPPAPQLVPLQPSGSGEMFASITRAPVRGWLPAVCSLALHAAAISGVVYYFDDTRHAVESLASHYSLRLIRLPPPALSHPTEPDSGGESHPAESAVSPAPGSALVKSSAAT